MSNSDQDLKTKKLKRSLEGWREILLGLNSLLLWEKKWHPSALFAAVTLLFVFVWASNPPVLTVLCTVGLCATAGDYLVPTVAAGLFRSELWTGAQEKRFDDICRQLVVYHTQICTWWASFYLMRTVRPKVYYATSVGALLFLAWIGNVVNNLLLAYLATLVLVMFPGVERHGFLKKYAGCVANKFTSLTKSDMKAN